MDIKKILLFFLVCFILTGCSSENVQPSFEIEKNPYETLELFGEEYEFDYSVKPLLLAGFDSYENKGQTDFIFLIVFNREKETFHTINIPREVITTVDLFDEDNNLISSNENYLNLVYEFAGGGITGANVLCDKVSGLINEIPINDYFMTNLGVFSDLIKVMPVQKIVLPNDSLKYIDEKYVEGYEFELTSENISLYLRGRDTNVDFSNVLRQGRQNALIVSVIETLNVNSIPQEEAFKIIEKSMSNISSYELSNYIDMISTFTYKGNIIIPGFYMKDVFDGFKINEDEWKIKLQELFYDIKTSN